MSTEARTAATIAAVVAEVRDRMATDRANVLARLAADGAGPDTLEAVSDWWSDEMDRAEAVVIATIVGGIAEMADDGATMH